MKYLLVLVISFNAVFLFAQANEPNKKIEDIFQDLFQQLDSVTMQDGMFFQFSDLPEMNSLFQELFATTSFNSLLSAEMNLDSAFQTMPFNSLQSPDFKSLMEQMEKQFPQGSLKTKPHQQEQQKERPSPKESTPFRDGQKKRKLYSL